MMISILKIIKTKNMRKLTVALVALISFACFNKGQAKDNEKVVKTYGANVLSFSPVTITDNGVAVGLTYEHCFGNKGNVSFVLPVYYSFNSLNAGVDYSYNYGGTNETRDPQHMLYIYPGIKFYPTGAFGKVRYAVGPSLVIGTGNHYENVEGVWNGYTSNYSELRNRFLLGIMIDNSLNINATEHLYLGVNVGLGITYVDQRDGVNRNTTSPLVKTGLLIGFRF
jgi:hypothetical protein